MELRQNNTIKYWTNISKEFVLKTIFKELKKNIYNNNSTNRDTLSRETETMKKNQMEILELKSIIINMKNLYYGQ